MAAEFQIEGLRDLRRDLKARGDGSHRELRKILNRGADRGVAEIRRAGRTPLERRIATTARARSTQSRLQIVAGGGRYPEAKGAEFGAARNVMRHRATGPYVGYRQFREYTPPGPGRGGRFFYPPIRLTGQEIVNDALAYLDDFVDDLAD